MDSFKFGALLLDFRYHMQYDLSLHHLILEKDLSCYSLSITLIFVQSLWTYIKNIYGTSFYFSIPNAI